jgi:hypothetical protein
VVYRSVYDFLGVTRLAGETGEVLPTSLLEAHRSYYNFPDWSEVATMSTAIEDLPAEASMHDEEATDISKFRKMCPRFRVLIVGRANSGKTTILNTH